MRLPRAKKFSAEIKNIETKIGYFVTRGKITDFSMNILNSLTKV